MEVCEGWEHVQEREVSVAAGTENILSLQRRDSESFHLGCEAVQSCELWCIRSGLSHLTPQGDRAVVPRTSFIAMQTKHGARLLSVTWLLFKANLPLPTQTVRDVVSQYYAINCKPQSLCFVIQTLTAANMQLWYNVRGRFRWPQNLSQALFFVRKCVFHRRMILKYASVSLFFPD